MKITIVGAGKVGLAITAQLADEGHDITVIDNDAARLSHVSDAYDVITLEGSGTDFNVLHEADVAGADLLIAATGQDEVNMVCSVAGRHLGAGHVAARMRDPIYISHTSELRECFGMSAVFNPEMEAAREIARVLQFPTAARVETFAGGRAELVEYRIPADSGLHGVPLHQLGKQYKAKVLVCAVERSGSVCIPNGDYVLQGGDRLNVVGRRSEIQRFFTGIGAFKKPVKTVLLLGGGRISMYLARQLLDAGMNVTIIERSRERCEILCEYLPGASVICADGSKQEVLLEEGIGRRDAFVALTGYDEDNIIVSMYALEQGAGKVVTKISESHFASMLERSGLDCFICPKMLAAQEITRYARAMQNAEGSSVETLYRLIDDKMEALEFVVGKHSRCVDVTLRELPIRSNILIAGVLRGGSYIIPDGSMTLQPGDRAMVVTTRSGLRDLDAILE